MSFELIVFAALTTFIPPSPERSPSYPLQLQPMHIADAGSILIEMLAQFDRATDELSTPIGAGTVFIQQVSGFLSRRKNADVTFAIMTQQIDLNPYKPSDSTRDNLFKAFAVSTKQARGTMTEAPNPY